MAEATPSGETGTPATPKTDATIPSTPTPTVKTEDNPELAQARKEAEQARMRANQLENELKKKTEAEEAAKTKQLEENEEWKSLAEQSKAKLEALEQEREAEKRSSELKEATADVFKEFPAEVIEIAEETGLSLNESSDEAKEALKAKLTKISERVVSANKPTPNNPAAPSSTTARAELLERSKYGDKQARQQVISNIPAVQAMRKMAGLSD